MERAYNAMHRMNFLWLRQPVHGVASGRWLCVSPPHVTLALYAGERGVSAKKGVRQPSYFANKQVCKSIILLKLALSLYSTHDSSFLKPTVLFFGEHEMGTWLDFPP
jgi:hypothetical protein